MARMSSTSGGPGRRMRFDWLAATGVVLVVLGVLQIANDALGGIGVMVVGGLLFCTSVIRAAIEGARR